jgi:hypothetical protein
MSGLNIWTDSYENIALSSILNKENTIWKCTIILYRDTFCCVEVIETVKIVSSTFTSQLRISLSKHFAASYFSIQNIICLMP